MQPTVLTAPQPDQCFTPGPIAACLDVAANLIEHAGLYRGDYWLTTLLPWKPGTPCDVVGALAVAAGYRNAGRVDSEFIALHSTPYDPHPVLRAVLTELRLPAVEDLFEWGDGADAVAKMAVLRGLAAKLRIAAGAPC